MEQGWARRHEFVELDTATLTALVQPIFPGQWVVSASLLTEGLANTNYKLRVSGQDEDYVLRLYTRERSACQKEWDIYRLVHDRIPVPEMLHADPDGHAFGRPYSICRWVEGVKLATLLAEGDLTAIGQAAYATGATLAQIHSYAFPMAGFFGPGLTVAQPLGPLAESYLGYLADRLLVGQAGQRLGPELTRKLWQFSGRNAHVLDGRTKHSVLGHADYKGTNLLLKPTAAGWRMAAVLDREFAFAGDPLFDVGILFRYDASFPALFESGFVAGYREQGGSLPDDWRRLARLLDLVNLCEFLNTADRSGRLVTDVTDLIVATLAGRES